jgi:hypothetical protein
MKKLSIKNQILAFRVLAVLAGFAVLNIATLLAYGTAELIMQAKGVASNAFSIAFPCSTIILAALGMYMIAEFGIIPLFKATTKNNKDRRKSKVAS